MPGILDVIGIGMLGPCLIAHGTEEQKGRRLEVPAAALAWYLAHALIAAESLGSV